MDTTVPPVPVLDKYGNVGQSKLNITHQRGHSVAAGHHVKVKHVSKSTILLTPQHLYTAHYGFTEMYVDKVETLSFIASCRQHVITGHQAIPITTAFLSFHPRIAAHQ